MYDIVMVNDASILGRVALVTGAISGIRRHFAYVKLAEAVAAIGLHTRKVGAYAARNAVPEGRCYQHISPFADLDTRGNLP